MTSSASPLLPPDPTAGPVAGDPPHRLLALVPDGLRSHPARTVVLLGLAGPRREIALVTRLALRDVLGPTGPGTVARTVARLALGDVEEVVAIVYSDDEDPRDPARGFRPDPAAAAVRAHAAVRDACRAVGPVSAWQVTHDRYLGLDCRDGSCCPPGGRPVSDLGPAPLARAVDGPLDLARLIPPAPAAARRSASAARSRWVDVRLRAARPVGLRLWRRRSWEAWRDALAAAADPHDLPTSAVLGRLEAALADPEVRDAVLLGVVDPGGLLPDALLRTGRPLPGPAACAGAPRPGPVVDRPVAEPPPRVDGQLDAALGVLPRGVARLDDPPTVACTHRPHVVDLTEGADREDAADLADLGGRWCADSGTPAGWAGADGCCGRCDACDPVPPDADGPGDLDDPAPAGGGTCRCRRSGGDGCRVTADPDEEEDVRDAVRDVLDGLVDPECAREPDAAALAAGRRVLEGVVAHGRRGHQAPALALLGLLAWWEGDPVRACLLTDEALRQDRTHGLARVVDRALGAGLPPAWMRRRC
ncbi:DUF4192 family protein [Cellulomonas triticagri]|nr:DUF4192 family protein [Cellulomonas triticagri]